MPSRRSWLLLLAPLAAVVVHCGSNDEGPIPPNPDAGTIPPGVEAGAADAGSTGTPDARAPGDASGIPEGGAPSDPDAIGCGGASCTGNQACCVRTDGGATCVGGGGACNDLGGVRQECNETADCSRTDAGARVCCYERDAPTGLLAAACRQDCSGGGATPRVQACRLLSDCITGTCAVRTCRPDAGGGTIESCTSYPGACP